MFWVRYIKGNKVELMCTSCKVFQRSSGDSRRQASCSGDGTCPGAEVIAGNPVGSGGWETGLFPEPCDSVGQTGLVQHITKKGPWQRSVRLEDLIPENGDDQQESSLQAWTGFFPEPVNIEKIS